MASAGADLAEIRSAALVASIKAGDRVVEDIVRSSARWIGVAVANVVNLLAPDVVVLGGGLVEEMPDLYLGEVEAVVKSQAISTLTETLRIAAAELGDDAVIMGAAALAQGAVSG
jgi:glucokinase